MGGNYIYLWIKKIYYDLDGMGLYDPCEKEPNDIVDILKNQQREELTASAQVFNY